jgi:Ankyrin repeats (3 copies)/Ankyrin repeat
MRYLLFDTFNIGFSRTDKDFETRLQSIILYDYATRNRGHHARISSSSTEEEKLKLDLLESEGKVSACSQAMMVSGSYLGYSQIFPRQMTEMHLAAYFGLVELITALLKRQHDLTPKDENGQTPLHWAARNGHEAVVKLLLEKGAELGPKDESDQTPLHWAAKNGHEAVVKLLLENGAEPGLKDKGGRTPLHLATRNRHEAAVKLLLEKGAEPD